MTARAGVPQHLTEVWIDGEGWVSWREIEESVDRAWRDCLHRWAMRGWRLADGAALREADIAEALAKRREAEDK